MDLPNLPYECDTPSGYRGVWHQIQLLMRLPLDLLASIFSSKHHDKLLEDSSQRRSNNILKAIIETATSSPDFIGVCVIETGVHGYFFQSEWIQLQDGNFLTRGWGDLQNETTPVNSMKLKLDLREELKNLRQENFILRSSNNKNPDVNSGMEGRHIHLYIAVGEDGEWLACPGPLLNGTYENNAVNRIVVATSQENMEVKLV